ncbi:MAG: Branched-chain amino acid transporter substrate-binding protein, partial [Rhizobacter sp.]|nr:Branched-chain amino acid transporter substrate-binding protein [Rhizobacter sp.]
MTRPSRLNRPLLRPVIAALVLGAALLAAALPARADISIGVTLSSTGPGASLGIPAEQALRMWPGEIAGQKVKFTILNDATDTSAATKNAAKLITEEKVDILIGSSTTPPSLAVVEAAGEAQVPLISLAGGGAIVMPQTGPRRWAFKLSPTEPISIALVLDHMLKHKVKTVATIGFSTSYGEGFLKAFQAAAPAKGVQISASERYNPTDQSITAQVVKVLATNPDAVYILASGTPGALPQVELVKRGYKGLIYQTQGVANADFLRVGGKDLEGGYMTVAPALVAEQLPDSNPVKKVAVDFVQRYEKAHGTGSRSLFAATAWDALLMIDTAGREALKKAKPGTPEFRSALRDALEGLKEFVGAEGVFNMSAQDHNGVDVRSQVLVKIE